MTIPNGPGGTVDIPKPTTATVYNISTAANPLAANVRDNVDYLDTTYKGVEFTATKRFSQQVADADGLHARQERRRGAAAGCGRNGS